MAGVVESLSDLHHFPSVSSQLSTVYYRISFCIYGLQLETGAGQDAGWVSVNSLISNKSPLLSTQNKTGEGGSDILFTCHIHWVQASLCLATPSPSLIALLHLSPPAFELRLIK